MRSVRLPGVDWIVSKRARAVQYSPTVHAVLTCSHVRLN